MLFTFVLITAVDLLLRMGYLILQSLISVDEAFSLLHRLYLKNVQIA